MRILYGVDAPRARALLVLGEHLDRNAYGPAVRRALAVWQTYLNDQKALTLDHVSGQGSL
jgi:Arc/MetJ family transcription regulator